MTDAEWLRERPEITQEWEDAYNRLDHQAERFRAYNAMFAILPHLRAAIRADVVRELARTAVDELKIHGVANRFSAAEQDADKRRGPASHGKAMAKLYELIAAAHAQGRAAGREEAAKVADAWSDQEKDKFANWPGVTEQGRETCAEIGNTLREFATAIRSLP